MKNRRIPVLVAGVAMTLAACGASDSSSSTSEPVPADTTADAVADDAVAVESSDATPDEVEEPVTVATEPPADEPPADEPPASDVVATEAPTDDEAASIETDPPVEQPAAPEVGGRALATVVEPDSQFDSNPFPDLVVADVGRSGEANLANLLPSERPLLLWAWAPH